MYITSSVFNIIRKQFEEIGLDNPHISSIVDIDTKLLNHASAKIPMEVLGEYIEFFVSRSGNNRLGLEKGFSVPVTIAGMLYKLYENCATLRDVFEKSDVHTPIINPLYNYQNRIEENVFVHRICVDSQFIEKYTLAARQLYESQLGITSQIIYSLTGRRIKPIMIRTIYRQDSDLDKINEYFDCPIQYGASEFALVFDSSILDLPVLNADNKLLSIVEKLIFETIDNESSTRLSIIVREQLLRSIPTIDISIKSIAQNLNLGERTFQRRLRAEGCSFREILNSIRVDLSKRYLMENIPLVEIAFLLGFDSQSAFNKFFQKHFKKQPTIFKRESDK